MSKPSFLRLTTNEHLGCDVMGLRHRRGDMFFNLDMGEQMSLTKRATEMHTNRRNAAKWVLAIRWMRNRSKNLWVHDGGKVKWGNK